MVQETQNSGVQDLEGSIFLPKTRNPAREFERHYFELMLGRGIGRDVEAGERVRMYEELVAVHYRLFGDKAIYLASHKAAA